jgi:hypothetical protein
MSFCLYVAARVFVQYLKWRPKDQSMIAQLQFLGSAMQALSRKNPLTESFMAQLELDLEGTGIFLGSRPSLWNTAPYCPPSKGKEARGILIDVDEPPPQRVPSEIPVNTDAVKCAPISEIRDSQSAGQSTNNNIFHPQRNSPGSSAYSPFETSINMTVDSAYNHLAPHDPIHISLPNRGKETPFQQRMAMMDQINGTASEIDFSTSGNSNNAKSRSNSYKDTSSNTSFTPPDSSNNDPSQVHMNTGNITNPSLSRHSPSPPSMATTSTSVAAADVMFFEVPDAAFQAFQPQLFSGPFPGGLSGADFPMTTTSSNWGDMTDIVEDGRGSVGATTGLTPLASGEWEDMLGTGSTGSYFNGR